jgi:hypothetical protein
MKIATITKPLRVLAKNYKIEDILRDNRLLMVCTGEFTNDDCDRYLAEIEAEVQSITEEKKLRKRIFYILVESMQNISRHKASETIPTDGSEPLLVVGQQEAYPYIMTANAIENTKINKLTEHLDRINRTGIGELRQLHRSVLDEGKISEAGGANLGLIDIARKAGGRLQYGFDPIDNNLSYFILKVNIDTGVQN